MIEEATEVVLVGGPEDGLVVTVGGAPVTIRVSERRMPFTRPTLTRASYAVDGFYRATTERRDGRPVYRWNGWRSRPRAGS